MQATHTIMDATGDTKHTFETSDEAAVAEAEKRFMELTGKGFRAAALTNDGQPGKLLKSFDPTVEQTLFIPNLQGG